MNDTFLRYTMGQFFEANTTMRVRSRKGLLEDKVYPAVLGGKIINEFNFAEIKRATARGWIEKQQIRVNGQITNVYLWKELELGQVHWWKRLWGRLGRFMDKISAYFSPR